MDEIVKQWLDGEEITDIALQNKISPHDVAEHIKAYIDNALADVNTNPDAVYVFALANLRRLVDALWDVYSLENAPRISQEIREAIKLMTNITTARKQETGDQEVVIEW